MTPEAFATAMAGFGPAPGRVAVAVSGGPHSLALALLTRQWARENGVALVALVAEHGLRRESAEEATGVATMLAGQGITTRVISLGLAGGASMQARARAARLKALLAACREWRAPWLLLGQQMSRTGKSLKQLVSEMQARFPASGEINLHLDDAKKGDADAFRRFFHKALELGVYFAPSPYEAGFISLAHGPLQIDDSLDICRTAIRHALG
jgi:glutamate-1-semialdehyde aminotransferase